MLVPHMRGGSPVSSAIRRQISSLSARFVSSAIAARKASTSASVAVVFGDMAAILTGRFPRSMQALTTRERVLLAVVAVAFELAGLGRYAGFPDLLALGLAAVALAGLAWVVSFATEQVGERFGPAVTGVMQSTLGNLPELFVVVFALKAGETVVAQTSILGSLFANALLVLGLVIVFGSRAERDSVMRFAPRRPNDPATLLLVCNFIIVVLAVSLSAHDPASRHTTTISAVGAVCLLAVYGAWVVPYARGDRGVTAAEGEEHTGPRVPLRVSAALLAVAGVGAAFVSDWFIHALDPAIEQLGV